MRHLAAAEANRYLDLVAVLEETAGVFNLYIQVANVNIRGQSNLLGLHDALVFARFFFTLGLFKAEPVSYTHLDVYKRQVFTFPFFMLTYVPISIVALMQKVEWKPIQHGVPLKHREE